MDGQLIFSKKTLHLNAEQMTAVKRNPFVHQRILATAGSGKTTTLTAKIAYLIEQFGVHPESIVLLTFSRNAATQMKSRVQTLIGDQAGHIWSGTFHGLSRSLLNIYEPTSLQKLYFIDELVGMGIRWLESTTGRKWVSKIRYIIVDEFQDINQLQWKFIQRILHPGARLTIVGDDAQNIYTWRGSNVRYILDLHKEIRGLEDDQLRMNYRSTAAIVAVANGILKHIPSLPWKGTIISTRERGPKPQVHFFWRSCDEATWILKMITILEHRNPSWTFAILSRTNADLYRLEERLIEEGRSYHLKDVMDETAAGNGNGNTEIIKNKSVDLVTLHASKGLEWDCVFFIGLNDDVFPSRKEAADILCERRLFYVGVTRARNQLFFSYTNKEKALCRFIREIPNIYLDYTGLARYSLSDVDLAGSRVRLIDLLSAFDGEEYQGLRDQGIFKPIERMNWILTQIYQQGIWTVPQWALGFDKGGDFYRFLRIWIYRHLWISLGRDEAFTEPSLERILFTLRIYAEEKEFFELWRSEMIEMLHFWFAENKPDPTPVEYSSVAAWAESKGLTWAPSDIVTATIILAKLRGQLRPLRFDGYDLNDFRVGSARYIVPTEWRCGALRSWKRVTNRELKWEDVLIDIWRLGALSLCAEGRNVSLYKVNELSKNIMSQEIVDFFRILEKSLAPWVASLSEGTIQFGVELLNQQIYTEQIDFIQGSCLWRICMEPKEDALKIFEQAARATLAREEGIEINQIGWILPLEGKIVQINLLSKWHRDVKTILNL
jgi:hypothetical protein